MAREAMDICLQVLKESNKSRFDRYSAKDSELIVSHITFWDCHVHIFSDNLEIAVYMYRGERSQHINLYYLTTCLDCPTKMT